MTMELKPRPSGQGFSGRCAGARPTEIGGWRGCAGADYFKQLDNCVLDFAAVLNGPVGWKLENLSLRIIRRVAGLSLGRARPLIRAARFRAVR